MNAGVELLLKRMETHPEEFIVRVNHGTSQWGMLIQQFADHFDEEDHVALKAGIRKCHQEVFTGKVMQSLAGEGEERKSPSITLTGATTGSWGNRTAIGTSAYLDAQRYQTEQLRIQLDAQREIMKQQEPTKYWWNKTIPELLGKK
jgi:hypothetical protein